MVPKGPAVQETLGKAGPVRTFQDLLKDAHDEALFDFYATSQLVLVEASGGKAAAAGAPGIFQQL